MTFFLRSLILLSILAGCAINPDTKHMTLKLDGGATFIGTGGITKQGYIPIKGKITFPKGSVFDITHSKIDYMPGNLTLRNGIQYMGIVLKRKYNTPIVYSYKSLIPSEVRLKNGIVIEQISFAQNRGRGNYYNARIVMPDGTKLWAPVGLYLGIGANPKKLKPFMFTGEVKINKEYSKHLVSTNQPLSKWPTRLQDATGVKPGYYGLLKDGVAFGAGSFLHNDGVLTVGSFKRGTIDGKATQYLTDGSTLSGNYSKGYKHGDFTHALKDNSTWSGRLAREKKEQWWVHKKGGLISGIEYFNDGISVDRINLNRTRSCQLTFAGKKMTFYPAGKRCGGTLYSMDSGTLLRDAEIVDAQVINAKSYVVLKQGYQGIIKDRIFAGVVFNRQGNVDYNGVIKQGLRDGKGMCGYEQAVEHCLYRYGERIDDMYLARVEEQRIQKWSDECQQKLQKVERLVYQSSQGDSMCSAKKYKKRLNDEYARDNKDGVSCDECQVQTLAIVDDAKQCISRLKKEASSHRKGLASSLSDLTTNQCIDSSQEGQLNQMVSNGMTINDERIQQFEKLVSNYESFGNKLEKAREKKLKSFYQQLDQDTHRYIVDRLGAIQSDVNKITLESQQQYNQIMKDYNVKRFENFDKYEAAQIPAVSVKLNTPNTELKTTPNVKVKNSAEILLLNKNKCQSLNGGNWKNNGCIFVIVPYTRDRLCYNPSGEICKTGERWNPDKNALKNISVSSSVTSNFTGKPSGGTAGTNYKYKKLAPQGSTPLVSDINSNSSTALQCQSNSVGCRKKCEAKYNDYCDDKPRGNGTNNCLNNEYLPLVSKCQKACFSPYESTCASFPADRGDNSSVDQ